MIGIVWNCRGVGCALTVRHLKDLVRSYKPNFLFLAKVKIDDKHRMQQLARFLGFSEFDFVPSIGLSGGLLLLWDHSVTFTVIFKNAHCINCLVFDDFVQSHWQLTFVYGPPIPSMRPQFWDCLQHIGEAYPGPWMLIGDFNVVLNACDKSGG